MNDSRMTIDDFHARDGVELHDYMERLLKNERLPVDIETAEAMIANRGQYDCFHLVYMLLVCARVIPNQLVEILPGYVAHLEPSVRAAAMNILRELESHYVTDRLLVTVKKEFEKLDNNDYLDQIVLDLESRLEHGR